MPTGRKRSSSRSTSEAHAIEGARSAGAGSVRLSLARRYLSGDFGSVDLAAAYMWTLAAWNLQLRDYESKFELAEVQQYLEYLLTPEEKGAAFEMLKILPVDEKTEFVPGEPFNPSWWGWEDDPVPIRPPERDFKEALVRWLTDLGWTTLSIDQRVAACPRCDAPTQDEWMMDYAARLDLLLRERLR